MWFNKGDQNSLESGLKRPMGNELCRRLHPNDSRNPFSFTVAPQGVMVWGRGTAPAVDRVLSLIVDLRCIFSLSFIPLEPYPARYARHLPHAGKAGDTRETCHPQTFGHRPIYICGEAATTTLNPEPFTPFTFYLQSKPDLYSTYSFFFTSIL